jgi:hypothetical protein
VQRSAAIKGSADMPILALFAAAVISSIIWYEAAERNLTSTQKAAFGVTALLAWILVLVVGNIVT